MKFLLALLFLGIATSANAGECDFIRFNKCESCDNPLAFSVGSDEACSYLCPNREVNHDGSGSFVLARNCALKKCPKDFPYRGEYGSCFATQLKASQNDYEMMEANVNEDGKVETSFVTAPYATDNQCPEDKPLLYSDKCFPCDEPDDLSVSETECAKCPNRVYKFYPKWDVEYCELLPPKDKPLQRWDGANFSCDEPKAISTKTHCNIEGDCEDVCPNRTILYSIGGNVPSVPNCPPEKPLMDSEGICYSCDVPISVGLEWNERLCQRFCPTQRHLLGNKCVLNNQIDVNKQTRPEASA